MKGDMFSYFQTNLAFFCIILTLRIIVKGTSTDSNKEEGKFHRWEVIGNLSDNFGLIGLVIVFLFLASWLISTIIYKVRRYDEIEVSLPLRAEVGSSNNEMQSMDV